MLVDPLQTPYDWMILQGEMPRRPKPQTPGLTGPQPINNWLTPLRAAVQIFRMFFRKVLPVVSVQLLAAVSWIQTRLTLYDRGVGNSFLALVEAF